MNDTLPILPLLGSAKHAIVRELHAGLHEQGYPEIREGHGCVFGFVDPEGSRLTALAERSGFTKQAVGEAVDDLQRLGYVERVPDPSDGRAKLVRLTARGTAARMAGREILFDIEKRWAAQIGEERVAAIREALEALYAAEDTGVPAAVEA
jgi:DNA-binding MarR family transcriptional regulator